jgi:hypothetical protein
MTTRLLSCCYLLLSGSGLFVIALSYGVAPARVLGRILKITVAERDLVHIFRAVMGLYLGFAILWVIGAFFSGLTRPAIISEVVFMAGVGSGRVISVLVDGRPSILLNIYLMLEVALAAIGTILL